MSFQKFKTNSFCVRQKHYSASKNIAGGITFNTKTGNEVNLLVDQCSMCNRKNSMVVSDNTIQAEGLSDFFKILGKKGFNASKKMAKNVLKNPGRALDLTANVASAVASRKPINITKSDQLLSYGKRVIPWELCLIFCYVNGTKNTKTIPICTTRK